MWVLSFTLFAFVGSNRGGTGVRSGWGTQVNLILMLISVYFINFFLLARGV